MSDEEKTIEEIIAELESIKKKKRNEENPVEQDEPVPINESAIKDEYEHLPGESIEPQEKLTLEQPQDGLSMEKPLEDRPPEAPPGEELLDSIFDEKASSAVPAEEVSDEGPRLDKFVDERLNGVSSEEILEVFEEPSPEETLTEAPREELVLDEFFKEEPQEEPSETNFEKGPHEELIFEKSVEEGLSEIGPDELRESGRKEEPELHLTSEKVFTAMEEEDLSPEGPPPDEYGHEPPDEPPLPPETGKPPRVSRMTILLGVILMILILVAYFVWPTMYEYGTTTIKENKYKVRIDRLTGVKEYDVMGKWQSTPPSEQSTYRARIKVPSTDTEKAAAITDSEKGREMEQAKTQAKASLEESKTVTVKVVEKQPEKVEVTIAKKELSTGVAENAPPEPIKATKEVTAAAPITTVNPASPQEPAKAVSAAEKKSEYAIQVASMRFKEFAEKLVETIGNKGFEGHMAAVKSKRGGVWHLVLIGHFSDKGQALAFMKEKKITENYPGCFIRELYNR